MAATAPPAAPVTPTAASAAPAQSIAVLPFENLSGYKENECFADGIAEELLNQLAKLPGLELAGNGGGVLGTAKVGRQRV